MIECAVGRQHEWCYPKYDTDQNQMRICLFCKKLQHQVLEWKEIKDD